MIVYMNVCPLLILNIQLCFQYIRHSKTVCTNEFHIQLQAATKKIRI